VVAVGADTDADGGTRVGVVAGASVLEPRDGTSLVEAGAVSFGAPVDVDVSTPGRVDVGVVDGWDGPLVLIDAIVSSTNVVAVGWVGMMPTEAVDDRPVGAASLVVGMRMEDMICAEVVVDEATVVLTVTVVVVDVFVLDVSATTSSSSPSPDPDPDSTASDVRDTDVVELAIGVVAAVFAVYVLVLLLLEVCVEAVVTVLDELDAVVVVRVLLLLEVCVEPVVTVLDELDAVVVVRVLLLLEVWVEPVVTVLVEVGVEATGVAG